MYAAPKMAFEGRGGGGGGGEMREGNGKPREWVQRGKGWSELTPRKQEGREGRAMVRGEREKDEATKKNKASE